MPIKKQESTLGFNFTQDDLDNQILAALDSTKKKITGVTPIVDILAKIKAAAKAQPKGKITTWQ